ncbi:MAG: histone deacetylase [Saprospiraceae bacterium]
MLKIAWSSTYKYALPDGHRFPMVKYELLPEQLLLEGTATHDNFFVPPPMQDSLILWTHTKEYLDKLNHQSLTPKEVRNIGFPMSPALIDRGKHIANGTFMCTDFAIQYGIAMNIAGGTHHSFADRGEGFCIFNDIAIAANILLQKYQNYKILIIDLDVHQGNGTAKIFEHDPRVFTFSMHGEKNYPVRKEHSDLDIGLSDGTTDHYYLSRLRQNLPTLLDELSPDFIFYLSGVDVLESDKLGRLSLTRKGCKERDRMVLNMAKSNKIPMVVSMGGGYSHTLVDILEAHANTFRLAQEIFF